MNEVTKWCITSQKHVEIIQYGEVSNRTYTEIRENLQVWYPFFSIPPDSSTSSVAAVPTMWRLAFRRRVQVVGPGGQLACNYQPINELLIGDVLLMAGPGCTIGLKSIGAVTVNKCSSSLTDLQLSSKHDFDLINYESREYALKIIKFSELVMRAFFNVFVVSQ